VFSQGQDILSGDVDISSLTIEAGDFDLASLTREFTGHPIYGNLLVTGDLSATALQVLFRSNPELAALNEQITALNIRYQSGEMSEADEAEMARLQAQAAPLQGELDST